MLRLLFPYTIYFVSWLHAKPLTNYPSDTTSPFTAKPGCEYEGKFYSLGERFNEKTDEEGGCYGLYCSYDGNIIPWENPNCATTTPTQPPDIQQGLTPHQTTLKRTATPSSQPTATTPKTTTPPTSRAPICEYEGKFYSPGERFNEGKDGKRCYGMYCSHDGIVVPWDDFNCSRTTSTPPSPNKHSPSKPHRSTRQPLTTQKATSPQTTKPKAISKQTVIPFSTLPPRTTVPRPPGCEYEGNFYSPGESFNEGSDDHGWCYGLYCTHDGSIVAWDNFNCKTTTPPLPTTTPPSPITTPEAPTTPVGCMHNGKFYPPGEISRGTDGENWCYGYICQSDGQVIAWDNWNCRSSTADSPTTTPPIPTTTPSLPTTTFDTPTTTSPQTSIPRTTTPTTTPSLPTTSQKAKPPTTNSTIIRATKKQATTKPASKSEELSQPTTIPQISTSGKASVHSTPQPVSGCFFEGKYYKNGDIISRVYHGWKWCSGWYCNAGTIDSWSNFNCANPTTIPISTRRLGGCYYNGEYYKDGEMVRTYEGSGNCNRFYCSGGVLIPHDGKECGSGFIASATEAKPPSEKANLLTKEKNIRATVTHLPTGKSSQPTKETKPPITQTRVTVEQTNPPSTKSRLPTKETSLAGKETTPRTTVYPKSTTFDSKKTITLHEPGLCFHDGKYYEEGDIASRDFESDNWCSGWYCKGGRMIPVNCGVLNGTLSKEDTLSHTPEAVVSPTTLGLQRSLCFHEGRYYEDGDLALNDFDSNNWCSSLLCQRGKMVPSNICATEETKQKTFSSPQVTQTPITTQAFEKISKIPKSTSTTLLTKLLSPKATATISSITTPETSKITLSTTITTPGASTGSLDTTKSTITTTTRSSDIPVRAKETTPTPSVQTTKPEIQRCYYKDSFYPPGEVTRGFLTDGRCFGVICDISGRIIQWVSDTCTPTQQPTAEIKATLPGCVYHDKYYPPGRINRISDGSNWCMDIICTEEGKIASLNNLNCNQGTTRSPTATSTSRPEEVTCLYDGFTHSPGVIREGVHKNGWCFKIVCQDNGEIYLWGDWNCKYKPPTTTPPETTTKPPTTTPSTARTCLYNGRNYPVGEITRGENDQGWCYGVTCREDGQVVLWGSMKCAKH